MRVAIISIFALSMLASAAFGRSDSAETTDDDHSQFMKDSECAFRCDNGKFCVKKDMRCDGVKDCDDGSDEKDCNEDSRSLDSSSEKPGKPIEAEIAPSQDGKPAHGTKTTPSSGDKTATSSTPTSTRKPSHHDTKGTTPEPMTSASISHQNLFVIPAIVTLVVTLVTIS